MTLGQGVKPPFPRTKTGCLTCRGRKVKCDEGKPNCRTCTRLKLDCRWQTDRSNTGGGKGGGSAWTSDLTAVVSAARKPVTQKTRIPGETFVFEFPNVDRAAMQYIHHYISFCSRFICYANDGDGNPFQKELVPFINTSPALLHSMVATAASHMSRTDASHRHKAAMHYSLALRELAKTLSDPTLARSNATLGACLLMCVYEITRSDGSMWQQHLQGARDLIQHRGGFSEDDFLSRFFSLLDVSGSIFANRGTLLEGSYWLEGASSSDQRPTTWPYYDTGELMTNQFHTMMVYMARLSRLSADSMTPEGRANPDDIRQKAEQVRADMAVWWAKSDPAVRDLPADWRRQPRPVKLTVPETLEYEALSSTVVVMLGCVIYTHLIADPYGDPSQNPELEALVTKVLEFCQETPEGCGLDFGLYWGLFMSGAAQFNNPQREEAILRKMRADTRIGIYVGAPLVVLLTAQHADRASQLLEILWTQQRLTNKRVDWRELQQASPLQV